MKKGTKGRTHSSSKIQALIKGFGQYSRPDVEDLEESKDYQIESPVCNPKRLLGMTGMLGSIEEETENSHSFTTSAFRSTKKSDLNMQSHFTIAS